MSLQSNHERVLNSLPPWKSRQFSYKTNGRTRRMANLMIQRNKVWYAQCTLDGIRLRDSLKTTDKDQAVERLAELFVLVRKGDYNYLGTKCDKLLDKYDPKTDRVNKLGVLKNHIRPEFGGKTFGECDFKEWAIKVAMERPRTTAVYFISVAKGVGLPIPEWKDIPLQQQKRWDATQILSEEQVLDVIHNHIPKKYIPLCLIACYSTLRRSSIVNLRKKDVDLNEGISVIAGRTIKSDVFIPMHQKLRDAFNLIKVVPMRDDDLWFPDFRGDTVGVAISRGFKKAGIGWVSFPHFRHFGACHMINNGEDIAVVSRWLGHKDIATTMIYARVNRGKLKLASKAFDEPKICENW